MNIIKTVLNQKNKLLYEEKLDIQAINELITKANDLNNKMQKNMVLANIYYLKTIYDLNYDNAIKACEYFEKIPFDCFTAESIMSYITCLELCYKYQKVKDILSKLMDSLQSFELQYYCLNHLVNYAFVVDGAMTKEEYFEHKKQLLELLDKERNRINSIIP